LLESGEEVNDAVCYLTDTEGKQWESRRELPKGTPAIFKFSELPPATLFVVSTNAANSERKGSNKGRNKGREG
jgi:hypothetical protein